MVNRGNRRLDRGANCDGVLATLPAIPHLKTGGASVTASTHRRPRPTRKPGSAAFHSSGRRMAPKSVHETLPGANSFLRFLHAVSPLRLNRKYLGSSAGTGGESRLWFSAVFIPVIFMKLPQDKTTIAGRGKGNLPVFARFEGRTGGRGFVQGYDHQQSLQLAYSAGPAQGLATRLSARLAFHSEQHTPASHSCFR